MISLDNTLQKAAWFSAWFDTAYYHRLYRHRDETEANLFIDALLSTLAPAYGSTMLDLGCGSGRHSSYLASKGYNVTGLDLSFSSIRTAKKRERPGLQYHKHDMRIPFGNRQYDFVFNFFTSFGYFKTWEEHVQVVKNMSASLKEDGTLLIDYLNLCYAEKHRNPVEEKDIDGVRYHINRWSDRNYLYKRIAIMDPQAAGPFEYVEQVARFTLDDFKELFRINRLEITGVYGNYDLSPYKRKTSKRMIMTAGLL